MDLAAKLQIKPGTLVAAIGAPAAGPDLTLLGAPGAPADAGVVIAFVRCRADLPAQAEAAIAAARGDRLAWFAWFAYPKAGQLGTDLNRDSLAATLSTHGIRPVRQVALDDVWSALRFRPD
jgi:hypothetical protein